MQKIKRRIIVGDKKIWITAASEQEYYEKIVEMVHLADAESSGEVVIREKHNFKDYAMYWYNVFSKPNLALTTARVYYQQLGRHIFPFLEDLNVEDISPTDIQTVFNSIEGAKQTKMKTKNILNMIFARAEEEGIIMRNPMRSLSIRIVGRAPRVTKPYTIEQMRFIVSHIGDVKSRLGRTFLALQSVHPLRLEETLGLKNEDIDLDNYTINIERAVTFPSRNEYLIKSTKTEASCRTIDLVPQIIPYLTLGKPDEFVFGGAEPISHGLLRETLERIRKDIGFEETISPRRFRTTVLTDIYNQTKNIKIAQAAAGHTTAAMTLKYYVKGRNNNTGTSTPIADIYHL